MTSSPTPDQSADDSIGVKREALRGPWQAVLASLGDAMTWDDYDGNGLDPEDVQILIVRGTALPDDTGRLPTSYRAVDMLIDFDMYGCDSNDEVEARWAQAQAMAAGLQQAADALEAGRG